MDDQSLMEHVSNVTVFARTTPWHRMWIIKAYQQHGEVVATTGDGVNDALALKMAKVGVRKQIFYNIQNLLSFQLSTAVAALTLSTLSTMFRLGNPLTMMQILFINIHMDGLPSQSLGVDPVGHVVMKRPPRQKDEPIITVQIIGCVLFTACIIMLRTLFIYAHELSDRSISRRDQTITFTCFVFLDLASALQNRGANCGFLQNRMRITTVLISFLTQLGGIRIPLFQSIFQAEALAIHNLSMILCLGVVPMRTQD
ncbi:High affinity Ca2+/Mn2+ P-type ATPase-like protein [Ceratobasidium sp. 423]|nr:High affinity Ca2+/Mn2+ P-type ATPase-like protein [Ceratobasidium sp. 423]